MAVTAFLARIDVKLIRSQAGGTLKKGPQTSDDPIQVTEDWFYFTFMVTLDCYG